VRGPGCYLARVAPALSEQEILDEVMVVTRRSFPPLPDLRLVERPGWMQIVTPSVTTGALNEVLFSALDDDDADAIIDATIAEYRALGLKFRWSVGPGTAPADLGERLARRGLTGSWGRGMARPTDSPPHADDPAITITEVDATTLGAFSDVTARGWDMDPAQTATLNGQILAAPERRQHMFLAYRHGEPVATASYVAFPRSAYLIGGVVLPAHRGHGLYRALVAARLAHARARGIELATSHARESSSAPILERLGFATVCRYPRYFG
jgi:GNAT superfamily N-acetyltransferase